MIRKRRREGRGRNLRPAETAVVFPADFVLAESYSVAAAAARDSAVFDALVVAFVTFAL